MRNINCTRNRIGVPIINFLARIFLTKEYRQLIFASKRVSLKEAIKESQG